MLTNFEPQCPDNARYYMCEAAKLLGIHRNTLLYIVNSGDIKFHTRATPKSSKIWFLGYDIKSYWRAHF